ncbi:MAG: helix-turn-helix transcriptional regulator [Gemmatimonadetes bacterium]|nr:helix-turn-helix transcriptional regulator [Gemmatimonadota bacterium]
MARRAYHEACGIAKALDLVGERWTLLVVRNLLLGPLRYSDLREGLPGITTNLLAKRLAEMVKGGLVVREQGAPPDGGWRYRLTERGAALEPVLQALGAWGWPALAKPDPRDARNIAWLLVALRRWYRGGRSLRAELVADGVPYRLVLTPERAEIARGTVEAPALRVRATADAARRLFLGQLGIESALREVTIEGSRRDFEQLVRAVMAPA